MPDKPIKYKIVISKDALSDIKSTKNYILNTFKYREYAENFSKKIKKAIKELDSFPKGYEATGYVIEGLSIYFKPYSTINLLCRRRFHHYGNPGLERPHVLAIYYQKDAENQQINLLQSPRFGEGLRIVQDHLDSKNFYAANPAFDCRNTGCTK